MFTVASFQRLLLAASLLSFAGCHVFQAEPPPASRTWPELNTAGAQQYRIDPARSAIQLKVYREGMLAKLGHNHVITASRIEGAVYLRDPVATSAFELTFPVGALLIDRPEDRRRAGSDFSGNIPAAHIRGTRDNLLGPHVLQADRFPEVALRSLGAQRRGQQLTWRVAVRVRDRISEISVPVTVRRSDRQLIAEGAVQLSQTALGLKPFCVLSGKLCVRDAIDAEFYLVAAAAD
jgi:hypothetical protein